MQDQSTKKGKGPWELGNASHWWCHLYGERCANIWAAGRSCSQWEKSMQKTWYFGGILPLKCTRWGLHGTAAEIDGFYKKKSLCHHITLDNQLQNI